MISWLTPTPSARAWKLSTRRWRKTGTATARTSAKSTWKRPARMAPRLGPQDQALRGTRAAPVGHELVNLGQSLAQARPRGDDQVHRVANHGIGDGDPPDQLLQPDDLLRVEDRLEPWASRLSCS